MRTNIDLDERLVQTAKTLAGIPTIKGVVHHALAELVRHRRQRGLRALRGTIDWEGDLSRMRRRRA